MSLVFTAVLNQRSEACKFLLGYTVPRALGEPVWKQTFRELDRWREARGGGSSDLMAVFLFTLRGRLLVGSWVDEGETEAERLE